MRVLLVTSQLTYMPDNYLPLFRALFELDSTPYMALASLDNLDQEILKSTAGLFYLGAKRVGASLTRNILELPLKRKEKLCHEFGIHHIRFKSMNDSRALQWVKDNKIDLILNLRTRCIYQREILNLPRLGCVNVHHGILPKYRGTLCDLYALSENRPAGFTIHLMNEKIDQGKIIKTCAVSDGSDTDYLTYLKKTAVIEAIEINKMIQKLKTNDSFGDLIDNFSEDIKFTKNPNKNQIKQFLNQGMTL